MENSKIAKIASLIENSLETEGYFKSKEFEQSREDFLFALGDLVGMMLDKDFERFLFLMYRMDVQENKLKAALQTKEADNVKFEIARIIFERQEQKLYWREKYKNHD